MDLFKHEKIARGADTFKKVIDYPVLICGAGSLGANLCENLARQGFGNLAIVDNDRIEMHNINQQPWGVRDVGQHKVNILANMLYRNLNVKVNPVMKYLDSKNIAKIVKSTKASLIIDCFDNSESRKVIYDFAKQSKINCFHVGFDGDFTIGRWNENYIVPTSNEGEDNCDYPLARNLTLIAVACASEAIINFITVQSKEQFCFTRKDHCLQYDGN